MFSDFLSWNVLDKYIFVFVKFVFLKQWKNRKMEKMLESREICLSDKVGTVCSIRYI